MWPENRPFLIFKESSMKKNLRRSVCWFGQILIVLPIYISISSLLQKFDFPIEVSAKFLVNTKGPGTSFQVLIKIFLLQFDISWPNFIN